MIKYLVLLFTILSISACQHSKERSDTLYSRHLQRNVKLTVINTPIPSDKSSLNLLLLNDGQDMEKFRVREIVDSLYKRKLIAPLVVVGIEAGDRMQEFGVTDKPDYQGRGARAGNYDAFINEELYFYAKKQAGVRKFNSLAIAGCSLGGLSAFDIAWNHPEKIDMVGVFSGSFWWRDKSADDSTYSDENNRIILSKLKVSRKKPHLRYWFYAGAAEEKSDRDKDGIIDVIDDTKDLITLLQHKNVAPASDIVYTESPTGQHDYPYWSSELPAFLIWAFGKRE